MNREKAHTYHFEALSLLTLRIVLTDASKDVPPQVSANDMNEERAAKLIKKMGRQYKKYLRLIGSTAHHPGLDW